ncbi:major capsid protein [Brucella anthropi]|uniref:major capsid protein n=1 Tax=Brucella anthropi TaxID=529 RepID=UPI000287E434|nr:hypothetical protein [Brucella anthropi]
MPAITLPEYAKGLEKSSIERPLIETFAEHSDIVQALPFSGFSGGSYEGYRETDIGNAQFRAINEGASDSQGKIAPFQETSFPIDTILKVDKAILARHGMDRRAREEAMQMKRQSTLFTDTFINGDNKSNAKEFNGVKARATVANGRRIHNSGASGGAALSLAALDEAIDNTTNPTHIIMSRAMKRRFIGAMRDTTIGGYISQTRDSMGRPVTSYNDLPILTGYPKDRHSAILPFSEVASGGGGAVTTSLFVVSFTEEGLHGIQLKSIEATDMGLLHPDNVFYGTNVSWDVGLVDDSDFCLTALDSIADGAIVK